ncbi:MAG: hypothetical protein COC01_08505 [Bacteroidetes bacterium]|nr:MAG: hypothetical protein COC01_08505 [Bacteroidota bacterium]
MKKLFSVSVFALMFLFANTVTTQTYASIPSLDESITITDVKCDGKDCNHKKCLEAKAACKAAKKCCAKKCAKKCAGKAKASSKCSHSKASSSSSSATKTLKE